MPKSFQQSIGLFMAYFGYCAYINEIFNLIGFSTNSNFSLALASLIDAGMP